MTAARAPLHVLMFGWEFPPRVSGGLGTACLGLTQGLRRAGVDVTFVLPRLFGGEPTHVRLVAADAGARLEVVAFDSPLAPYLGAEAYDDRLAGARASFDPSGGRAVVARRGHGAGDPYGGDLFAEVRRYARAARGIARDRSPDLVHAHDWMTFPAATEAAAACDRPLVVHVHATEHDRNGRTPDERIREVERRGLAAADRVVAVSRYAARSLRRWYGVPPAKLRVVHNAVRWPARVPRRRRPPSRDPVVLFLGRVTSQKGPATFLDAAAIVAAERPDARFVLAGSGDLLPAMIERAARAGFGRRVHFTGFLEGAEVARAYRMADVFVLPSLSEPFGIAPLEALAHGVPVVVSRRSGVAEVLPSAPRVPAGDARALARAITALLRDPAAARRLAARGRREARALTWTRQARRLRDVYAEVAR